MKIKVTYKNLLQNVGKHSLAMKILIVEFMFDTHIFRFHQEF